MNFIEMELRCYKNPNVKRSKEYRIQLYWEGCGSVFVGPPFKVRREALQTFWRIRRRITNNRKFHGFMPVLENMRDLFEKAGRKDLS